MIADTLDKLKTYDVKDIGKAIDFIKGLDKSIPDGKYEVPGIDGYANVTSYTTKNAEDGKWEVHRTYLDVQAVLEGDEIMYVSPLSMMEEDVPYSAEKDCAAPKGEALVSQVLMPDYAAILFPQDVHMPKMVNKENKFVKKVIVKIKL